MGVAQDGQLLGALRLRRGQTLRRTPPRHVSPPLSDPHRPPLTFVPSSPFQAIIDRNTQYSLCAARPNGQTEYLPLQFLVQQESSTPHSTATSSVQARSLLTSPCVVSCHAQVRRSSCSTTTFRWRRVGATSPSRPTAPRPRPRLRLYLAARANPTVEPNKQHHPTYYLADFFLFLFYFLFFNKLLKIEKSKKSCACRVVRRKPNAFSSLYSGGGG